MSWRRAVGTAVAIFGTMLTAGTSSGQPVEPSAPGKARSFAEMLEQARGNAEVRGSLVVEAEGHLAEGVTALLLFGDGVGVVNRARQFRVPDETVVAVLDLLVARGVSTWPEESSAPEGNALEIHRYLQLSIDEARHTVIERNRRPARPSLQRLLGEMVELVRPFTAAGIGVSSVEEGLRWVAEGKLAPHVFTLNALAPGTSGAEEGATGGWQLTVRRNLLTAARYSFSGGVTVLSRRPVAAGEIQELARLLVETEAMRLPVQVPLEKGYFQLHVELLGQKFDLQARPFAGKVGAQRVEAREALVRLRGRLHQRFARETGTSVPGPG